MVGLYPPALELTINKISIHVVIFARVYVKQNRAVVGCPGRHYNFIHVSLIMCQSNYGIITPIKDIITQGNIWKQTEVAGDHLPSYVIQTYVITPYKNIFQIYILEKRHLQEKQTFIYKIGFFLFYFNIIFNVKYCNNCITYFMFNDTDKQCYFVLILL